MKTINLFVPLLPNYRNREGCNLYVINIHPAPNHLSMSSGSRLNTFMLQGLSTKCIFFPIFISFISLKHSV